MYMPAFICNCYMYRCCSAMYVSLFTIGYYMCDMSLAGCALAVVHGCVHIAGLCPSCNVARCGFHVIVWYLSDDGLSFIACYCINLFLCFFVWAVVPLLILDHHVIS